MPDALYDRSQTVGDMNEGSTLEDLVQSAQAGSHYAFGLLQRRYAGRMFKQIISITRHHEDAEDALQDTLCKAYVALPLFERRCHIYTWMSRIAINCALMKVRKRKGLREMSLNHQDHPDDQEPAEDLPDPQWSPEEICGVRVAQADHGCFQGARPHLQTCPFHACQQRVHVRGDRRRLECFGIGSKSTIVPSSP